MKRIALGILSVLCLLGCAVLWFQASASPVNPPEKPISETAYTPRTIQNIRVIGYQNKGIISETFTKRPHRVIAVGENINETLVALGVEDSVICPVAYGNPFYRPAPENAEVYQKISFSRTGILNPESVLAMEPDLIISGQSVFNQKSLRSTDFWNERGVHTFLPVNANSPTSRSYRETLEQEYDFILGLGRIFDQEDKAKALVQEWKDEIRHIRTKTQGMHQKKVLIVEMMGRQLVAYDDTKLAGNICKKLGAYVPHAPEGTVGLEYLIEENPDVLFVIISGGNPETAAERIKNIPALESLACIQQNHVYGMMLNNTYNSAIKTGEGIRLFAEGIYPELKNR